MKKSIYLFAYLSIFLSVNLIGQVIDKQALEKGTSIQRNTLFNLDEIKVRWKKAALENCPGVPCVVSPPAPSFTCGTSTITDIDNNIYNTVLIGTQCWTKENLKVTKYNDGTSIPLDNSGSSTGSASGVTWSSKVTGAYTIYANELSTGTNATNYGYLYNWYAAVGIITNGGSPTKNICPTGWHVPTDAEWTTLTTYLGGESVAGGKMKSTSSLWNAPNTDATNSSSFSVLPGGSRSNNGSFSDVRGSANFWSANEMVTNLNNAWIRTLYNSFSNAFRGNDFKQSGFSIRCLRD